MNFAIPPAARRLLVTGGEGSKQRDCTGIVDVAPGIAGASRHSFPRAAGFEVVNLGESQCTALSEPIAMIEEVAGVRAIVDRRPAQTGDVPLSHADGSKARRFFGYEPSMPMRTGIERFVAWPRARETEAVAA